MKLFKTNKNIYLFLGIILMLTKSYGQVMNKTQQLKFSVKENIAIEIDSRYTNIEFELTNNDAVVIDAIMRVEGLSQKEVDTYFEKWNFKADKFNNKLVINSFLIDNSDEGLKKSGYHKGYFLNKEKLNITKSEIKSLKENLTSSNLKQRKKNGDKLLEKSSGEFDFETYIEKGNTYLEQWERENNKPIGKRFYNKTKEERKQMWKSKKDAQPKKSNKPTTIDKATLKSKSKLPNINVRALSRRATINKTLKIKIPKKAKLNIKARHGKVVFSEEITNLNAELNYVLLEANAISGKNTSIKGAYSNFEINKWNDGNLDVIFSGFVLIKEVKNIDIISNASTVSIDNITESVNAKGNFKMLSVDTSSEIKYVNIDVEDSKRVWIKLPKTVYNLHYEGINSKLIHPEKFSLKTIKSNPRKQVIENNPLEGNERLVKIKALSSVMQIYDIPWENLKVKNL